MDTREFSNKISRYRKRLLSYASGRVIELGVGTGANLPFYRGDVDEVIGVDWSDKMLIKAFENIDTAKTKET
jgi:predicted TPR repeat methyltransferase